MELLQAIGQLLIALGIAVFLARLGGLFSPSKRAKATPEVEELAARALEVITAHRDGIALVELGRELGLDWRQLIAPINHLLREGRVEKRGRLYFPR